MLSLLKSTQQVCSQLLVATLIIPIFSLFSSLL